MLLSGICRDEIAEYNGKEGEKNVARSFFFRDATNLILVAIAIGTPNHGGLAKLSIQGTFPEPCCD